MSAEVGSGVVDLHNANYDDMADGQDDSAEKDDQEVDGIAKKIIEVNGVESIFTGPGFLTLTKEENSDWNIINNDILNKFDTI